MFRYDFHCVPFAAALGLAGCTSLPSLSLPSFGSAPVALQLDIAAKIEPGHVIHSQRPVVLRVAKYADARPGAPSAKIGDIQSTVFDMHGAELVMEDLPGTVTAAMTNQLGAIGFQTVAAGGTTAAASGDFELSGVIREFSMNIAGRDEVSIVVATTLRDTRGGGVLWSGVVTERADRFAGVAGNTRSSITRYLSAALAKVSVKTRDAVSGSIVNTHPDLFSQAAPARGATPGVTVLVAPPERVTASQDARPGVTGQLEISTIPPRAKVYMAEVYYGLSPLRLNLEPGIYTLHFKLEDFRTATEKVSVRKDETTELEIKFEK
jgi:hypothetical protein